MNTLTFLKHVLPSTGYKFIAVPRVNEQGKEVFAHLSADTFEKAAALVAKFDSSGHQVYFACSSFEQPYIETDKVNKYGKFKRKYRVQENALAAKALWLDLDCGEGKDYPTQEEALEDITRFCAESALPVPLLVNSGNGVHAYWVFNRELNVTQWKKIASMFRAVVDSFGVRHDPVCTTDICRVLRPVGSHNRKRDPKPVVVYNEAPLPEVVNVLEFANSLKHLIADRGLTVREDRQPAFVNELSSGMETVYPPSSAVEIAKSCNQVKLFAESHGNVVEPVWHAMIGLLKHTIESNDVCHQWSSGHPQYSESETQEKIDGWERGPSTCARLGELNASGCEGCQYKGKITSPIQLGVVVVQKPIEDSPATVEPCDESNSDEGMAEHIEQMPESMSEEYGWSDGLVAKTVGKNGLPSIAKFCDQYFWAVDYYVNNSGHYEMVWKIRERPGVYKEFKLTGAAIAVGGQSLYKELGERGIVPITRNKKYMDAYIASWFNVLKKQAEETHVYKQYGWQADWSFVMGSKRYLPNGDVIKVRLSGDAALQKYTQAFEPHGSAEEWINLIDRAYNYEGQEQYQFMLGVGFGAPLLRLFQNYGGLTINGFSPERGLGKSSAGELALSIYGNPKLLFQTKQGTTFNAFTSHCGVMNSLPVVLDEVTNIDPKELSDMLYHFSQGKGKDRLNRSAGQTENTLNWSTLLQTSSNRSLISLVGAMKASADAEMGRIMEWQFKKTTKFTKEEADSIIERAKLVYGQVGIEYIKYIVANREEVTELLLKTRRAIDERVGATTQDRFSSAGVASVITGLFIAKQLGLVNFNIGNLTNWAVIKLRDLRDTIAVSSPPITEQFANMLTELNKGFIVTNIEGDARSGHAAMLIRGPVGNNITGRLIQDTNTLYINQATVRKWCAHNQSDYSEMFRIMVGSGAVHFDVPHYNISKGTKEYALAPARCWKVDLNNVLGYEVPAAEVKPLRSVGS